VLPWLEAETRRALDLSRPLDYPNENGRVVRTASRRRQSQSDVEAAYSGGPATIVRLSRRERTTAAQALVD